MMSVSVFEDGLVRLEQVLTEFADVTNDIKTHAIRKNSLPYTAEQVKSHLTNLKDKERLLKVGIIGRVKAGKSSLINALLFNGREVLPKAATPMTAALTTIGYSDKFRAQVDFFGQEDLAKLKENAKSYKDGLDRAIAEEREEARKRATERQKPVAAQELDDERLRAKAKRQFDERESTLKSAADLYERMIKSAANGEKLPASKKLEAPSEADLNKELLQYVGSEGKYMPFTKSLHIGLPMESLTDMVVIDTPGLNDAVASREQRTYEMLKECNVVFIVSPAGQFLNAQDLDLAGRLTKRDGIQEIYIVASQIDTQLHGNEREKYKGRLPDVINGVHQILAKQSENTLINQDNEVLSAIASLQDERLFITSGICQTLLAQPESEWDDGARHALKLLMKNYPDYFSNSEAQAGWLGSLSGRERLLDSIGVVRQKKEEIIVRQVSDFIRAQEKSMAEAVGLLITHFKSKAHEVEGANLSSIEGDLRQLKSVRTKGANKANGTFKDFVEEFEITLGAALGELLRQFTKEIKGDMDSAEGSESRTVKRENSGFFSWCGRKLGMGGYDSHQESYTTVNARVIRGALEDFRAFIQGGLSDVTQRQTQIWRKKLTAELIAKLREAIGDDRIDADQILLVCRHAIGSMRDLPAPQIAELPASLARSGRLSDCSAEEYIEEAGNYLSLLQKEADKFVRTIRKSAKEMVDFDMGAKLFDSLEKEVQDLHELVENKRVTLDKLKRVVHELEEVGRLYG